MVCKLCSKILNLSIWKMIMNILKISTLIRHQNNKNNNNNLNMIHLKEILYIAEQRKAAFGK
jgi:hypothetical protein